MQPSRYSLRLNICSSCSNRQSHDNIRSRSTTYAHTHTPTHAPARTRTHTPTRQTHCSATALPCANNSLRRYPYALHLHQLSSLSPAPFLRWGASIPLLGSYSYCSGGTPRGERLLAGASLNLRNLDLSPTYLNTFGGGIVSLNSSALDSLLRSMTFHTRQVPG